MTRQAPLVSVIVPNYRHADFLAERLRSIAQQTMQDLEIILLDDSSEDGSVEILREFAVREARVSALIVNERNSGSPFAQWRKGIELARGTWIWIAESDDSCMPDLLAHVLELDARAGGLGIVYTGSRIIDEQGGDAGSMRVLTSAFVPDPFAGELVLEGRDLVARFLKVKNVVPNASAVLFRRELVLAFPLWSAIEGMRMCGDWLFWIGLAQRARVGYSPVELNRFRHHPGISRVHRSLNRKRLRLAEESRVRDVLATMDGVDQHEEELALYRAWTDLFPWQALLSKAFDEVRLRGRGRLSFLCTAVQAKYRTRRARRS